MTAGDTTLPGFSSRSLAVVPIDLNTTARSDADVNTTVDRFLRAADRVTGEASAMAALVPMTGSYLTVSGQADRADIAMSMDMDANVVSSGYFELMGTPVRAGRTFDARDRERAPQVAIVSDTPREVIGVVGDVPYRSLTAASQPVVYVPVAQSRRDRLMLHARARNEGEAIATLKSALRAVDTRVLVGDALSMRRLLDQTKTGGRVAQRAGAIAGLLQLGLALMATWGLVAYAVERRTAEIAIRRALGATEAGILRLVMRPSLWLLAIGAPICAVAGVAAATVLPSTFLGLAPIEVGLVLPATAALVPALLVAAWIPARRALGSEPAAALKQP